MQGEDSAEITNFFSNKTPASFFGSLDFIEWVKTIYHQLQKNKEIPQTRHLAPAIAEIKRRVCQYYKVEDIRLEQTKRGQVNKPRNVAVYLARKRCGLCLKEIGQEFGLEQYSSVSDIVTRPEKQLSQNKQLQDRINEISLVL